jgi:hypothetical protein
MVTHIFTIILDRMPTPQELDALFETLQGDISFTGEEGVASFAIHHETDDTFLKVASSAIHEIERVGLNVAHLVSGNDGPLIAKLVGEAVATHRRKVIATKLMGEMVAAMDEGDAWRLRERREAMRDLADLQNELGLTE